MTPARLRAGVVKVGLGQPCLNGIGHSWRHASAGRGFCSGRDRPTIQHPYTTLPPAVAFYLHHCQVDHLWSSWQSYPGNETINFSEPPGTQGQPDQATWDKQSWSFVNGEGTLESVGPKKAVGQELGYKYDSLTPKPPAVQTAATVLLVSTAGASTKANGGPAAIAKTGPVTVGSGGATTIIAPTATVDGTQRMLEAATPGTTLVLEDVKLVRRPPAPLYVFLNLPEGAAPDITGPNLCGRDQLVHVDPVAPRR